MKDKSNLIQVISFLLIIAILAVYVLNVFNKHTNGDIFQFGLELGGGSIPAELIESGVTVEQTFVAQDNYLCRLDILLSHYTEPDDSDTMIELFDEKNNVIFSETVPVHEIEANSYRTIEFEPVPNSKGKTFKITLINLLALYIFEFPHFFNHFKS